MRGRALVIGALAGCGLGPAPDAGPTISTGIAPWTDLGPAQVCLGTQALAPPSAPPGGLCQSVASPDPIACEADRDCQSRETCFCGQCMVAYCAVASDCEAPRICNFAQHRCDLPCDDDRDCATAERCLGSVCRARCLDGGDCQQGEVCEGNTCVGDDCSTDDDCFGEERCLVQRIPRIVLEPSPVRAGDRIVLYLDIADPATPDQRAIWRAVGRDDLHFVVEPATPIAIGRAPAAVGSVLYYEHGDGEELRAVTSDDGIAFGAPVTLLAGPDVHAPTAIHADGIAHVYFTRGGAIAHASGPIGGALDDHGSVLAPADAQVGDGTPGTAFWIDIAQLASPHAVLAEPEREVHLFFAGFGRESAAGERFGSPAEIPPNFSIGFAAAPLADPGAFTGWPYGPVADRVEVFLEHRDELAPATVERAPGSFRLYFVDATHDATPTFTPGRLRALGAGR